jgi:hypothetical protein
VPARNSSKAMAEEIATEDMSVRNASKNVAAFIACKNVSVRNLLTMCPKGRVCDK